MSQRRREWDRWRKAAQKRVEIFSKSLHIPDRLHISNASARGTLQQTAVSPSGRNCKDDPPRCGDTSAMRTDKMCVSQRPPPFIKNNRHNDDGNQNQDHEESTQQYLHKNSFFTVWCSGLHTIAYPSAVTILSRCVAAVKRAASVYLQK